MADTNFTILAGEYWSYDITVTKESSALDLDDWTPQGTIRPSHWTSDTVVNITFTEIDNDLGQTRMSLTATQTATLPYTGDNTLVYDVVVENTNAADAAYGQVVRILEGTITVDPRSTIT